MADLRVGGLISGIDVNGVVQELVKARSGILNQLKNEKEKIEIEKDVLKDINDLIFDLRKSVLNLKLQSTFLAKKVSSSNPSVLSATASVDAAFGTHTVKVLNVATPARASSLYTRARLIDAGSTGIDSISGRPSDNVEGRDEIEITYDSVNAKYWAVDKFYVNGLARISYLKGDTVAESSTVEGTVSTSISAGSAISFSYGGVNLTAETGIDYVADTTDLNEVALDIQDSLNKAINDYKGTTDVTYVMVRVVPQLGTGNDALIVYDVGGEGISFSSGTVTDALGLSNSVSGYSDYVETKLYADTLADLNTKMNNYLIPGVTFNAVSLSEGTAEIIRDASLNIQPWEYPKVLGGSGVSSGSGLDLDAIGLQNTGFAEDATSKINGTFTINGVKITIDDYTQVSLRDILAMINSSGAGVTAYYDSANDRIVIRGNEYGGKIELGSADDTSNFLDVAKLTVLDGAQFVEGSDGGKIDPTLPLAQTGLTVAPTSGTFTINGVQIYVDVYKDSLNDLIDKVNKSGAGVRMFYDNALDKIVITSDPDSSSTNADWITLGSSTDTSNILYAFNLIEDSTTEQRVGSKGEDAVVEVDGVRYVRPTNTIDDILGGVTLYIYDKSDGYVTLNVSPDEDAIVDSFAEFIANYNKVIEKLNPPELSDFEKRFLQPLTDEDKASMTDDEIRQYEEKHREYMSYEIIRNNAELRDFLNRLRETVFSIVPGLSTYNDLTDVGITTDYFGTYESQLKGYLITKSTDKDEIKELLMDNDKFMEAVRNNTMDLYRLMAADNDDEKGIARKISDVIDAYFGINGAVFSYIKPGGYLDRELRDINKRIFRESEALAAYESQLWQKFALMDQTIAKLQAESQYMLMQLGMSGGK